MLYGGSMLHGGYELGQPNNPVKPI